MPKKFQLTVEIDQINETISLSGELSDSEVKLLERFVEEAENVWRSDFINSEEKGRFSIEWTDETQSLKTSVVLPDWNEVVVFLHNFRPILLNNESTNFYKIHNLLAKRLNHPYFRNSLGVQHELYSGKTCQAEVQIRSNQVLLNSERVLFDWLNSHEFHRDEDRREFIESLHQMIPLNASKVIFIRLLLHKAIATRKLADLILVVLGKKREIETLMKPIGVAASES